MAVKATKRSIWRWILGATVTALLVAVFTAPLGSSGVCPSHGECHIWQTNVLVFPVPEWLWLVATPVAFLAVIVAGIRSGRRASPPR
jgi:hypothetical protein